MLAALVAASTSCGGGAGGTADVPPESRVPGPRPISEVYILEADGGPPTDTTVSFTAGTPRVVVVRHPAPDHAMFAEVAFDSASFATAGGEVQVTIRPRPGVYGIDLESGSALRQARVTFKYAVHFLAPADARARYGSDIAFERQLFVGALQGDRVTFLPSARPATDNLAATLPGPGSYVVSAPRDASPAPAP